MNRLAWSIRCVAVAILVPGSVFLAATKLPKAHNDLPGSTEDHVASARWWPTKATGARAAYAGAAACVRCHSDEAFSQTDTAMAKAAVRLSRDIRGPEPARGSFESGPYSYQIVSAEDGLSLEVRSGAQSIASKLGWTIGAGNHGQTYLFEDGPALYEAQVSSFSSTHRLDLTPGHRPALHGSLEGARGNRLGPREAAQCLSCHTTAWATDGKLDPANAVPGIHCEACHGPGLAHVQAAADKTAKVRSTIFNPAHLTPANSIDFCGSCHRTTMDVVLNDRPSGLSSVRFQPYRLQKSRCWIKTEDDRLTCVGCHDPHQPLVRETASYDQVCLSCHSPQAHAAQLVAGRSASGSPAVCPKATKACTSCHMPSYKLPEMHSNFTDHFIRVVRSDEIYPN
jgi:hypothetical protein